MEKKKGERKEEKKGAECAGSRYINYDAFRIGRPGGRARESFSPRQINACFIKRDAFIGRRRAHVRN